MRHNNFNKEKDQYWFVSSQLRDHLKDYDILNIAAKDENIKKYEFVKLTNINGNDLTDSALTILGKQIINFVYNFSIMKNQ